MKAKKLFIIASLLLAVFILGGTQAKALTISPARIEVSGDPGTTVSKDITLFNDNQISPEKYYVSYANFEAQGETGSPAFVEPKSGLGTWMSTDEIIELAPGGSKTVTVKINIPENADAGGHFAVIFFGTNPNEQEGQVSVGAKTGTLILLSVNGDVLEAGGLLSFNTKDHKTFYNSLPVDFLYRWKNDGNDRVKPQGKITMHNFLYIPVAKIDANAVSGNILPHSTRMFEVTWLKYQKDKNAFPPVTFIGKFFDQALYQWKNFAIGPYFARLNLVYGTQNLHSKKTAFFFVFPWQLIICLAVIIFLLFFLGSKTLKRYNRYIIEKARQVSDTR